MNALTEIKTRFSTVLADMVEESSEDLLAMIRPAQDSKFGDYQANCAMPLGKRLGKPPRDIATELVDKVSINDMCEKVEIAGPGFINLTLDETWLKERLAAAFSDDRLGIPTTSSAKTIVVDYSSPNVAKPMHVGHIRSTVIGAALANILRFIGHNVITDNHLGDWGTQFGMIIYGYKNFVNERAYKDQPIPELSRLYKFVRQLMDYHGALKSLPEAEELLGKQKTALEKLEAQEPTGDKSADKKTKKDIGRLKAKIGEQGELIEGFNAKIDAINADPELKGLANEHSEISASVLEETAKLHDGDAENKALWNEFLPFCLDDIQRIYNRLEVTFDHVHGESFYHDMLPDVVTDLLAKGLARESEGAICVFMDDFETPMIIQKKDGAYLYPTSDLATVKYRAEHFKADSMLYVVDHRQHQHFEKFFQASRLWGFNDPELTHVSFGTVLGDDGKPFKTRSGDTVGLEGLLDEAESRALKIAKDENPNLTDSEHEAIATTVGIGALKYADLSQNRASDYKFNYDKMLATKGNTATYLQYTYARVQGIFRKLEIDVDALRKNPSPYVFEKDVERKLAVKIIRLGETLDEVVVEYKPNLLCNYLFDLTQTFFQFYDQCSVKDASSEEVRKSRIQLCDLTARTIQTGLGLLGISVMDQM